MENTTQFAERINPGRLGFSPKLTAIVGAIIGYDYGVRDGVRGGQLLGDFAITSDGFVTCRSSASDGGGAFLGDAANFERNIEQFLEVLTDEDRAEFNRFYAAQVKDWRQS